MDLIFYNRIANELFIISGTDHGATCFAIGLLKKSDGQWILIGEL